jgi:two-component system, cell cycle response regulator DivK
VIHEFRRNLTEIDTRVAHWVRGETQMEQPRKTHTRQAPLVMVADDAEDAREVYGQYLALRGYRVVTAADGADAVQRARTCRPDIILMDLRMPRVDGWEAIRQLKSDPRTSSIPVVAISAHGHGAARSEARSAGADACLTKPCLPPQLLMMVRALLSWRDAGVPALQSGSLTFPNPMTRMSEQKPEM